FVEIWEVPQRQFASTAALPFSDDSPSLSTQEPYPSRTVHRYHTPSIPGRVAVSAHHPTHLRCSRPTSRPVLQSVSPSAPTFSPTRRPAAVPTLPFSRTDCRAVTCSRSAGCNEKSVP